MSRPVQTLIAGLALLAGLAAPAAAALPAGYSFRPVLDAVPASVFRDSYADQTLSVATALNANGTLIGFWLNGAGEFHTHSLLFGSNPQMTVLNTTDFIGLSGSDVGCRNFLGALLCSNEYAFGIRVVPSADPLLPDTAVTAFVNTPTDGTALPGSLPFVLYPGNFVDENRRGIVASTQISDSAQFGAIFHAGGTALLEDVPWLVAINDLATPLALGYDGSDGDCLVFGDDCAPDPEDCEDGDGDTHHHQHGQGHEEHGNGHGYGHYKCRDRSAAPAVVAAETGALLLRLESDGSVTRFRFPAAATIGDAQRPLLNVFPLAINADRAVLRGDIVVGDTTYERRLLSCTFDAAALDAAGDGIVDCTGGLTVPGGLAGSIRAGTVLGFALNDAGLLTGNFGYNAAGIGTPFVTDLAAATPQAVPLADLATGLEGWEANTLTDINPAGRMSGYGYRDCSALPQAFFVDAAASAPAGGLRFVRGTFEQPAWLAPGATLAIAPQVTGGSGSYEFRVSTRTPADTAWTLLSDWSASAGSWASGSFQGEICLRVQVRDTTAPDTVREQIVRYAVTPDDTGSEDGGDPLDTGLTADRDFALADLLGGTGVWLLAGLLLLGLRRRR